MREIVGQLDLGAFHDVYRSERGRPPFHPALMVGLYFYGAARRTYSSSWLGTDRVRIGRTPTWRSESCVLR